MCVSMADCDRAYCRYLARHFANRSRALRTMMPREVALMDESVRACAAHERGFNGVDQAGVSVRYVVAHAMRRAR